MGNAVLKALVRVFLPLIILILLVVATIALVKMCSRRESERGSDDYLVNELLTEEIKTQPVEEV